ncbi:MAG: hypothetical protein V7L23_11120 [Nostoc sp.]|uniref:hypothetical protein n=1 Tax=Nostoc sp. TaxID=1180 RepID=UPI002FF17B47
MLVKLTPKPHYDQYPDFSPHLSKPVLVQGSRGAEEQRSRGAGEQGSRGAREHWEDIKQVKIFYIN